MMLSQAADTETANALMAAYNEPRDLARFLDKGYNWSVQANDGRILGKGPTKAGAWNAFADLQNLISETRINGLLRLRDEALQASRGADAELAAEITEYIAGIDGQLGEPTA